MKAARAILAAAVSLSVVGIAHADLCARSSPSTAIQPSVSQNDTPKAPASEHETLRELVCVDGDLLGLLGPESALPCAPFTGLSAQVPIADTAPQTAVYELPALPSSSHMFLSALLSVGAWQFLRKARNMDLGHLPEWYHPDAPHQIGHSHAFDPQLGFDVLPVCLFDIPIGDERSVIYHPPPTLSERLTSQSNMVSVAPRGPPC